VSGNCCSGGLFECDAPFVVSSVEPDIGEFESAEEMLPVDNDPTVEPDMDLQSRTGCEGTAVSCVTIDPQAFVACTFG
jgi:hypothetical protein